MIEYETYNEKVNGDDLKLTIYYDEYADDPREWDNLTTMVCWHSRYNLGDKHDFSTMSDFIDYLIDTCEASDDEKRKLHKLNNFRTIKALNIILKKLIDFGTYCKKLYLYDHSGITISTGDFGDVWDSGMVGFVYITQKTIENETGYPKEEWKETASRFIDGEVKTYDDFLTGEVFGYTLEKITYCETCGDEHLEEVDACCGFYGTDFKENGLLDNIPKEFYKHF